MSFEIEELKDMHERAHVANRDNAKEATDDAYFHHISQWDADIKSASSLRLEATFDITSKAVRRMTGKLENAQVNIDFEVEDEDRRDGADVADGMYLNDNRLNSSKEAVDNAILEMVVSGMGAWEVYTTYKTNSMGDNHQVIRRRPIFEAYRTCLIDPDATLRDKSDADFMSVITGFTEDGYKKAVKDLTGEEPNIIDSFYEPERDYKFRWYSRGIEEVIYITSFYHREKVKDNILRLVNPYNEEMLISEHSIESVMDELVEGGYQIDFVKEIERWEVMRYIATGEDIIKREAVAGEHIPITPMYGERGYIDRIETYQGFIRKAKDPQRLHNFQNCYVMDVVSTSPAAKPMFYPEQIAGLTDMYQENGADNRFPYYLIRKTTAKGEQLPEGPVGQMPGPILPDAILQSIELSRRSVEDVASVGVEKDMRDPDLSGKAYEVIQVNTDEQTAIYLNFVKYAKRRDAEIWASMASQTYDTPRTVNISRRDGSRDSVELMKTVIDEETGNVAVLNDITNIQFEVYAEVSTSYSTKRDQTIDRLSNLQAKMDPSDPKSSILTLKVMELMDGVDLDDIRKYARREQMIQGIIEPESDEEKEFMQQMANKEQEPSAEMVYAQAAQMKEEREAIKDQANNEIARLKEQTSTFKAITEREKVKIAAHEAGAEINFKNLRATGQQIDNVLKLGGSLRANVNG